MKTGIEIIAEERKRQIETKGYTIVGDDQYRRSELARAAAVYATPEDLRDYPTFGMRKPFSFAWSVEYWKPSPNNRIKELAKAGALIAAEIDRLQRLAAKEGQTNE